MVSNSCFITNTNGLEQKLKHCVYRKYILILNSFLTKAPHLQPLRGYRSGTLVENGLPHVDNTNKTAH